MIDLFGMHKVYMIKDARSNYTQSGQIIRNPNANTKTERQCTPQDIQKSKDINAPTAIYKINLEGGKKYVGKTTNVDRRMDQHF